jgi:dihydrofolate synthase/folylpolyglutamate synthase
VLNRLEITPPPGRVFTIAGTNGKGTAVHYLGALLTASGWRCGIYTSPHLVRYNERIRLGPAFAQDAELVSAFEAVEARRRQVPLTYFEFGTAAAAWLFDRAGLDAWLLEVGLGGRLDAVNAIDPDYSLITSVAMDHEEWLGHTIDEIAREKAGILRAGRAAFYGASPVPAAIAGRAAAIGAPLSVAGEDFGHAREGESWRWWNAALELPDLPLPEPGDAPQLANLSLALAAAAACDPALVSRERVLTAVGAGGPPGRFQRLARHGRTWLLDVAHNPQAAEALAVKLRSLAPAKDTTVVVGLHANKAVDGFLAPLRGIADRWIACRAGARAGLGAGELAARVADQVQGEVLWRDDPADALALALARSAPGARIVVCGSFEVVGPALDWLGASPGP